MSINIVKHPGGTDYLAFVKNGAYYKIQSTTHLTSSGAYANITLTITHWPISSDQIKFVWTKDEEITQLLEFKNAPDDSGLQLKAHGTETEDEYSELIAAQLSQNYFLIRDFAITWDTGGKIYLIAREKGALAPAITFPAGTHVAATINSAGSDVTQKENYKIICYVQNGSTRFPDDLIPVDNDGIGEIDLAEYCLSVLNPMFTTEFTDIYEKKTDAIKEFDVQFAEYYGNPAIPQGMLTANLYSFMAMRGGVGKLRLATMQPSGDVLYGMLENRQQFLTWLPVTRKIDRRMLDSIFWLHFTDSVTINIKAKCYYTDGSDATYSCGSITGCAKYDVYEIVTNPDKLFIDVTLTTVPNHYIYKFDLWLTDVNNNTISQIRTFEIDYTPYQNIRYFKYLNSLGAWDTIRTTGNYEKSKSYEFQQIAKVLDIDFAQTDFELQNIDVEESEIYKAASGWLNKETTEFKQLAEVFAELFRAEKAFEITDEGPVPICITKPEHLVRKDDEALQAIGFEYRKTYKDKVFTNVVDSGTALGVGGYFGQGFGGGFVIPPIDEIIAPLGS